MNTEQLSWEDECVLHFAVRYALNRHGATPIILARLKKDWPRLSKGTKEQIRREIGYAFEYDPAAGAVIESWREVLELP